MRHRIHRDTRRLTLLLTLATLLIACGGEDTPHPEDLSLRELLGLAPERAAELSPNARTLFTQRLAFAWNQAVEHDLETLQITLPPHLVHTTPLQPPLHFVQTFDHQRAPLGFEVRITAHLQARGTTASIHPLPIHPEALGLTLDSRIHITPLNPHENTFTRDLHYDDAWGRVDDPNLHNHSQLHAARSLEPALRRLIHIVHPDAPNAQIVPAPRAPLALWYAHQHRALFINPNLLFLLHDPSPPTPPTSTLAGSGASGPYRTLEAPLELDFIEQCVQDQIDRCAHCTPSFPPTDPLCQPLFPNASPQNECANLAQANNDGFRLYCYHLSLTTNLSCFQDADPQNSCGAAALPIASTDALSSLSPMLTDETCQLQLQTCHEARNQSSDPPRPPSTRSADSTSDECLDDCLGAGCEVGLQVLLEIACSSCSEAACDSLDSGSACEGDTGGGACAGDTGGSDCGSADSSGSGAPPPPPEDAPSDTFKGLLFTSPFAFLFGMFFAYRKE